MCHMRARLSFAGLLLAPALHAQLAPNSVCAPGATRSGDVGSPSRAWNDTTDRGKPVHVFGEIVTVGGRPIRSASAVLRAGAGTVSFANTDSAGRFFLTAPGERADYTLTVRAIGYLKQVHSVEPLAGTTDTLCIRMRIWARGPGPIVPLSRQRPRSPRPLK